MIPYIYNILQLNFSGVFMLMHGCIIFLSPRLLGIYVILKCAIKNDDTCLGYNFYMNFSSG